MEMVNKFIIDHFWEIAFAIFFAIIVGIIEKIFKPLRHRWGKTKALYEVIWKKSSSLKPDEILGLRGDPKYGFHEYYYQRLLDESIKDKIRDNKNVLITGNPLAGKSRAIYQALITLNKPHSVIIPKLVDIENLEDFRIPFCFSFWSKQILVLNDLDKYVAKKNFMHLFQKFLDRDTIIVASCRSGSEYDKLCKHMEDYHFDISQIFGTPIEVPKVSKNEGEKVAKETNKKLPESFDGNIGSIFLELETMKERFRTSSEVEKGILRSMRRLYYAGIYREREIFSIERIKLVCKEKEGIVKEPYMWSELFNKLKKNYFLEIKKDEVVAEEAYLQFVIEDGLWALDNLNEMMGIFIKDSDALLSLGNQAYDIGGVELQKAEYMRVAINANEEALKVYTLDRFPMQYATTQNNLGVAYRTLAEVEAKAENCKMAINANEEALKVFTEKEFPEIYPLVEQNLRRLLNLCRGD